MAIDTIKSTAVLDGAIATADIADDAVTADKLANAINTDIAAKAPIASPTFTGTTTANLLASNGTILGLQTNGTAVGGIGTLGGATYFGSQDSGIMFNGVNQNPTNGTSTRVDNTNDLGAASYRYKDIYLGGGAFLGGTATANKLDDYEEGYFTPIIGAYTGTAPSVSSTGGMQGQYTKVGNLVVAHVQMAGVTLSGTTSGICVIKGFPFVSNTSSPNVEATGCLGAVNRITFARPAFQGLQWISNVGLAFLSNTNGGSWGWEINTIWQSNSIMRLSISYFTDS